MLKALSVTDLPTSISLLREDAAIFDDIFQPMMADADDLYDDDGDDSKGDGGGSEGGNGKGRSKSRRELPSGAVATLKAWLLSPEHFTHPYPTPQDQAMLMQKTGIDKKQLKNWFTNARRRIWKPMLKKQIEQGKLATSGPGGVVPVGGGVPGLTMISTMPGGVPTMSGSTLDNPHSVQAMRVHYQQVVQQQQDSLQQQQQLLQQQQQQQQQAQQQAQAATSDAYGNVVYSSAPSAMGSFFTSSLQQQNPLDSTQNLLATSASIGTLPQLSSSAQLSKTDSHAVLMELFARDQDLVRQATESARLKAESKQHPGASASASAQSSAQGGGGGQQQQVSNQHPMKAPSFQTQGISMAAAVPTLSSWPHFSSITSLNNLGTMPGVKSIASLSGADLVSKGNLNKMGNLAQVKSMESMGKNDSYAFLEVFFGDRSSNNLSGMAGKDGKGQKLGCGGGDEDNEIGLSLEDESPSQLTFRKEYISSQPLAQPAPLGPSTSQESGMDSGMLKRAYDDALAARGLISVSRSSERLTDLVLPAKIQRTLSQEFINKQQQYGQYSYLPAPTASSASPPGSDMNNSKPAAQSSSSSSEQHQYAGQHPGEPSAIGEVDGSGHVQVPSTTRCALCNQVNVDTQLRPCGHMFHERCLKPSLQTPMGPPTCPLDNIPMLSALLAVPTDNVLSSSNQQQQTHPQPTTSSWSSFQNSQSTETT